MKSLLVVCSCVGVFGPILDAPEAGRMRATRSPVTAGVGGSRQAGPVSTDRVTYFRPRSLWE